MKTWVYLKDEEILKSVDITDGKRPKIPNEMQEKWRKKLNIISDLLGVSSVLIMEITPKSFDVFLKNNNKKNPYEIGASEILGPGLFNELVIGRNKVLYIENILETDFVQEDLSLHKDMVSYYGQPIHWSNGNFFGTICLLNNTKFELTNVFKHIITELREMIEKDLQLLEKEEFNNFFDICLDLLCIATIDGDFIRVNNSWEKLLGFQRKNLMKMNFLDLVHPDDLMSTEQAIGELIQKRKIFNFINRFQNKNGKYHFFEWNSKISNNGNYIYASARDITDQVLQYEKNKQQKRELDFILVGVDAGTWQWNVQTGKTKVNDRWAELLGFELAELEPTSVETWRNFIHPEDLKIAEASLQEHFNGEIEKYDVEIRMKHKDGHWVWMNDLGKVLSWTKNNEPYEMFGVHIDVSERKEKEEKVRRTKALLENLSNQVPGAIYQYKLSPDGIMSFPYASNGIYEIYELLPEEVKKDSEKAFNTIHPDDYDQVYRSIQRSAKELTPWHEIYRVDLPKQGLKWLEGKSTPEQLEDGSVLWHGYLSDITEKKQREEKIKASEKKYRTIFESAPNPIFIIDRKGNIRDVNDRGLDMLMYDKEELLKSNAKHLVVKADQRKILKKKKKMSLTDQITLELQLITKDKRKLNVILDAVSIDEDLYLAFVKNITKRIEERNALDFQYRFQRKLAEVASNILDINASNFNDKVNLSLKKIGIFFDIDRSYVYKYEKAHNHFYLGHEWCRSELISLGLIQKKLKINKFPLPWWIEKLINNEVIYIEHISDLKTEEKVEGNFFKKRNINSIIIIPIFIENVLYGFLGFDIINSNRTFTTKDVDLFLLFTEIMKNAISKYNNDIEIQNLTYKDHLTGLYNRRFFEEELRRLNTKRQLPLSVIVADINGLKIINDSLGHRNGDLHIQKAASILKAVTRDEDILARLSGDEFALILPKMDKKSSELILKRINKIMKEESNVIKSVSMALGLAVKTSEKQDIEEVLQKADTNMYQNKLLSSGSVKGKIVQNLVNTLAVKSNETKAHALRMKKLAIHLAEALELSSTEINRLSLLATLHDVGKITISEEILKKAGKLTKEEWEIVKGHCENGYRIANASEEFALIAKEIFSHHERWDGNGYPQNLKGEEIPYLSRIISIIDAYDVMTHDQHYKKSIGKVKALEEISNCSGGQFDPTLASVFIDLMKKSY